VPVGMELGSPAAVLVTSVSGHPNWAPFAAVQDEVRSSGPLEAERSVQCKMPGRRTLALGT
jgi:hypothetical protein